MNRFPWYYLVLLLVLSGCVGAPLAVSPSRPKEQVSMQDSMKETKKNNEHFFLTEEVLSRLTFRGTSSFRDNKSKILLVRDGNLHSIETDKKDTRDENGNLIVKDRYDTRKVVILIHGGGSEQRNPFFLWGQYLQYTYEHSTYKDVLQKDAAYYLYTYDSRESIDVIAKRFLEEFEDTFGARQAILIGHSMGGLVALSAYNLAAEKNLFLGVITLGSPLRGTPLAIPKMMRAAFQTEASGDQKKGIILNLLYSAYVHNFLNGFKVFTGEKKALDILDDIKHDFLNEGFRANAFDGSNPGIPEMSFQTKYPIGMFSVGISETLSSIDGYMSRCDGSYIYLFQSLSTPPIKIKNGICYFNYANQLRRIDQKNNLLPYIIAYAGYFIGDNLMEKGNAFFQSITGTDILTDALRNTTEEYERRGQEWLALLFRKMPAVKKDSNTMNDYWLSDGITSVSSALNLEDGESIIDSSSTPESLIVNEPHIQARLSGSVSAYRLMKNYSHRELVTGKDSSDGVLFDSINRDIISLINEYDDTKDYTLNETEEIHLKQAVENSIEEISEQLVPSPQHATYTTIRRALSQFKSDAHPTKADYAFLRYTIYEMTEITHISNNGNQTSEPKNERYIRYAGEWKKIGTKWYMIWKYTPTEAQ